MNVIKTMLPVDRIAFSSITILYYLISHLFGLTDRLYHRLLSGGTYLPHNLMSDYVSFYIFVLLAIIIITEICELDNLIISRQFIYVYAIT